MKIAATLREERNLGDHGEFVTIAQEVHDGETVEQFVKRVMKVGDRWRSVNYADSIVLQIVEGTAESVAPEPTPDPWSNL